MGAHHAPRGDHTTALAGRGLLTLAAAASLLGSGSSLASAHESHGTPQQPAEGLPVAALLAVPATDPEPDAEPDAVDGGLTAPVTDPVDTVTDGATAFVTDPVDEATGGEPIQQEPADPFEICRLPVADVPVYCNS
jgi:hypothetical protein